MTVTQSTRSGIELGQNPGPQTEQPPWENVA
jgi:hypothetical protein